MEANVGDKVVVALYQAMSLHHGLMFGDTVSPIKSMVKDVCNNIVNNIDRDRFLFMLWKLRAIAGPDARHMISLALQCHRLHSSWVSTSLGCYFEREDGPT